MLLNDFIPKEFLELPDGIYDPYYCEGSVAKHFEEQSGIKLIHQKLCFYSTFADIVKPGMGILTNPPWQEMHFRPLGEILSTLDLPFIMLGHMDIFRRDYFHGSLLQKVKSKKKLESFYTP